MKRGSSRKKKSSKGFRSSGEASRKVLRLPPSSEAARDEGPRLIPLDDRAKDPSRLEHYLDLADTALGMKRGPKAK
ncbi:MAG TPA: hypothetical protein VFA85_09250 [Terriglobales bacterium]|nr:hypothetical protein [Terriglobales bacterium]